MKKLFFWGMLLLICSGVSVLFSQNEAPSFPPELTGEALYEQGLNLTNQEKYREAIPCLQEAARRKNGFGEAYLQLGICYLNTKQFEKAKQNLALAKNLCGDKNLKQQAVTLLNRIPEEIERENIRVEEENYRKEKEEKAKLAETEKLKRETKPADPVIAQTPAAARPEEETKTTGRLVKIEGTVNFKPSFQDSWKPAVLQMAVGQNGWLQTAAGSRAILAFGKEAVITVSENSVLEVKELEVTPSGTVKVKTNLTRGKIWSLVEKLKNEKSRYEVETPTAIAGVRGTTFMVNVDPDGQSSRIAVVEGEVGVRSMGEKPAYVVLKENMATVVVYNKPPTPPELLEAREAAEWQSWKESIPFSEIGAIGGMAEMHAMQMEEAAKLVRETGFQKKASKKADEDFKVFEAALQQYYRDTGSFPDSKQGGLKALLKNPGVEGWNGPYADPGSNFMDPYGKPYFYHVKKTQKGTVYVEIFSMGLEGPIGNVLTPKK